MRRQNLLKPDHVAIIMDGNRRYGEAHLHDAFKGHAAGAEAAEAAIRACRVAEVPYLTLFAFSTDNWKRSKEEVRLLMDLFRRFVREKLEPIVQEGVRVRFIGRRDRLPPDIVYLMSRVEERSKDQTKMTLTIALDYGGRDEIVRAAAKLVRKALTFRINPFSITHAQFAACLDSGDLPDVDLLIRTGSEQRLSGFLLWLSAYAELYFSSVPWPQFDADEFDDALAYYTLRERRFGGDAVKEPAPVAA